MHYSRRRFLSWLGKTAGVVAAANSLPPSIERALAIPAARNKGNIKDVQHIVVLMLENRSFDHYFGTYPGVRGFADPLPIPLPALDGKKRTVWQQAMQHPTGSHLIQPFRLDTEVDFGEMRVTGAPHVWSNAQQAWNGGKVDMWPTYKKPHSMAYFGATDLPFQFALAEAFTLGDAYHCSFQGGTNPNRVFLFTGTNDGRPSGDGPAIGNLYNTFEGGNTRGGYGWTTYPERLEAAGISWRVYQNMEVDFFALNPLVGFRQYRDAYHAVPGSNPALKEKALSTYDLPQLRDDVLHDRLPQVSWICPTANGSEHPLPSSPAQGAQYTSDVLDALTANPAVWASTVLLIMFDENDGFFDHMPPPAPPSVLEWRGSVAASVTAGASSVDASDEYHQAQSAEADDTEAFLHRPYGLGPRVPIYAVSPWSKGGWVNSEVFDHTSVIRFIEQRFGVAEPNISAWRRAVCGDLTSLFDFSIEPAGPAAVLPSTAALARRAMALKHTVTPLVPDVPAPLLQAKGPRRSRALPYRFAVTAQAALGTISLSINNIGGTGAVLHVYDQNELAALPRRYSVAAGKTLADRWSSAQSSGYDLWVLGPNGFHRRFAGPARAALIEVELIEEPALERVRVVLVNGSDLEVTFAAAANVYGEAPRQQLLAPASRMVWLYGTSASGSWYDIDVRVPDVAGFRRRFAGRMETGHDLISDPAMHGAALLDDAATDAT
jgi:phospholipase C